ncbi:protein phosphatase 2C domain-containing protein [Janibacter cremeus]|uniref:Protein phosphatase n=1 Tax=Janibacter cremeus TaxID=1285192 RepID=A0A852VS40_9MICO|nr:protein phosphatase [Janibacter cremeus]
MSSVSEIRGRLRIGSATDTGRVRDHNEDALLAEGSVLVVADGMGGHAAGEVASGIAVETMRELVDRDEPTPDDVTGQILRANERILDSVRTHPQQRGMGTTVTGLVLVTHEDRAQWAVVNVGDSRVYRLVGEGLTRVTVDHSEVQELIDAGVITPAQAEVHPARNIVTRSLGAPLRHRPDIWLVPPTPGERFLACSDGLTNELTDEQLREILQAHPDPRAAADELVRAAVAAGGKDNVSVVVVALDDADIDQVPAGER